MDHFHIRPISEADVEAIVLKAGGERAHPDHDRRNLRGADFVLGDLIIELKALDEDGFDKLPRQQKLAALFRARELLRPVIVIDRERLPEEDKRAYDRIVEGPVKNAVKSAKGQLEQSRIEYPNTKASILFLLNNGYTALDHDALLALAERRARNDSREIQGVIVAGCYFYSDTFDSYFIWPIDYVSVQSGSEPPELDALRAAWHAFAEEAMTELMIHGHGTDAIKGPVVDMQFDVDDVTYVKPAPPMGRKSDFFVRGRPRKNTSGLDRCPPVGLTHPNLSFAEWARLRKVLRGSPELCETYDEWRIRQNEGANASDPMMPFVAVPVTAAAFKSWCATNNRTASYSALKSHANLAFDTRLRELLMSARERTPRTLLPARYVLAVTEEIGQDQANDVSHIALVHELMSGETKIHPVLEDARMFHEYALALACAHGIAMGVDAVLWQKNQTYGWV